MEVGLPAGARGRGGELAIALAAGVLILSVSMADGGYFPNEWRSVTFALCCVSAVALLVRDQVKLGRFSVAALVVLTAVVVWTRLSAWWSIQAPAASLEAERSLVYLVGLFAVLVVVEQESIGSAVAGLLAGITAVCVYALLDYGLSSPSLDPLALLGAPLGYPNALGILSAIGVLLAIGLAVHTDARPFRLLVLTSLLATVPALVLTQSRGAWLALVLGLIVMAGLSRGPRWRLLAATVLALAALGAIALAAVGPISGKALADLSGNDRWHYWQVAWQDYRAHPLLGSGAGTFGIYWGSHAQIHSGALDAHSLYLESLAELGPVGLGLLVALLLLPLIAVWKSGHRLAPVLCGAFLAFVVHAGIDWDWEMPAVTLSGLCLAGALLVSAPRGGGTVSLDPRGRVVLILVSLGLAAWMAVRLETHTGLW